MYRFQVELSLSQSSILRLKRLDRCSLRGLRGLRGLNGTEGVKGAKKCGKGQGMGDKWDKATEGGGDDS